MISCLVIALLPCPDWRVFGRRILVKPLKRMTGLLYVIICIRNVLLLGSMSSTLHVFNRIYITPMRIKKMFINATGICFKWKKIKDTFFHCFWYCDKILPYWKKIHSVMKDLLELNFDMTPALYLLNLNVNSLLFIYCPGIFS